VAAVLVHIDVDPVDGRPNPSSLVALAAGRHVASSWGATLYAAVILHDEASDRAPSDSVTKMVIAPTLPGLESLQARLARAGADKIVVALSAVTVEPLWAIIGNVWQAVLDHLRPRLVLFGADTPSAAELGPRTGARIGARLLTRARSLGVDDVELRDRDGGYARVTDSGAAVVLVGHAPPVIAGGDIDVDLVVVTAAAGPDSRVEVVSSVAAELAHMTGPIVALGDDVVNDPAIARDARLLADQLGGHLVGGPAAVRAGVVEPGAVVDRQTALAPELLIQIGTAPVDVAGATSVIRIGAPGGKAVDGALAGPVAENLPGLVKRLTEPPPRVRAASEPAGGGARR
jgi:electron transfer flavoprotein alpha subunit